METCQILNEGGNGLQIIRNYSKLSSNDLGDHVHSGVCHRADGGGDKEELRVLENLSEIPNHLFTYL